MTIDISNNAARVNYTVASGVTQTSFSVPFEFFNDSDLSVYVDDVLKTITTHYTVSGGDGSTGTITMSVTGASGGSKVVIVRSIAIERTSDFQTGVDINRAALNTQLDTLTAIAADNQDKANRSITAPVSESSPSLELPSVDNRKGKTLSFNETSGNLETGPTVSEISNAQTYATNAAASATAAATSKTNAATSATSAAGSATTATTKASEASTSSTNASTAKTAAETAKTAAETAKTAAETAKTNAATSETNAATSAATATTQAATATTKASEAATSATASATSATASEAAKDAALAALDNFDDRYLGAKASNPTVDNDGNALVSGALYFNTTDDVMKVYEGSQWLAAYASLSGALLVANNLSDLASASAGRTNLGLGTAATTAATAYATAAQGTTADAALPKTGGAVTGNVTFGDSNKIVMGAGSDLQLYHDGSHSYIQDAGTGNFELSSNGDGFYFRDGSSNYLLTLSNGGPAKLWHNGSAKLATSSSGIDVTGTVNADALTGIGSIDSTTAAAIGAAGVGGTTLISTTTISSAVGTVDIALPTGYGAFELFLEGVTPSSTGVSSTLSVRFSSDNGSSYYQTSGSYNVNGSNAAQLQISATNDFNNEVYIALTVQGAKNSGVRTTVFSEQLLMNTDGTFRGAAVIGGGYNGDTVMTNIRIFPNGGSLNIASGIIRLYGRAV